jgi:transcriptional regulator with XRE-family HTH domain
MPDVMMVGKFGERLRQLRKGADLTQQQLADAAGLALSAVAKLEQGKGDPTWNTVRVLAKALGVSVAEFDVPDEAAEGEQRQPKKRKPKK